MVACDADRGVQALEFEVERVAEGVDEGGGDPSRAFGVDALGYVFQFRAIFDRGDCRLAPGRGLLETPPFERSYKSPLANTWT